MKDTEIERYDEQHEDATKMTDVRVNVCAFVYGKQIGRDRVERVEEIE